VAYQITSILEGVVQRGTGEAAKVLNRPVAGKTGTTNDSRDTWFIGYTPDLVVGTFVGFDTPRSLGEKETGGRVAIQGFIKFMQQAANELPIKEFRAPPGIREIAINRATGQPLYDGKAGSDAKSIIMEAFLTGGPIFKPSNELDEELKDKDNHTGPVIEPEDNGDAPPDPNNPNAKTFEQPKPGEMVPYQRPVDPQGFDPNAGAGVGTGGLY
jgi:penicillin-binding protein 1A